MLHDISVLLPVDRPAGALIECAASVATLFDAHLDGIACVYQALNPMIASEAAAVVMAAEHDTGVEQAAAVLDQFEIVTRRLDIPYDARSTFDVSYAATRTVTQMSRLYDLNIVASRTARTRARPTTCRRRCCSARAGRCSWFPTSPRRRSRPIACWSAGTAEYRPRGPCMTPCRSFARPRPVSYTHLRAHET